MSEWKEVPAWEALKALQEGTHDVEFSPINSERWARDSLEYFVARKELQYRVRPKLRTVDVIGLPVPLHVSGVYCVVVKLDDKYQDVFRYSCDYKTESEARRAYEALCAASK